MNRALIPLFLSLALTGAAASVDTPQSDAPPPSGLIRRIRGELAGPPTADSLPNPGVPHGELIEGSVDDSAVYPGTVNAFRVYVPAQYSPARPACLLLRLDGLGSTLPTVLDNLIAKGDMPVTIAVGLSSGAVWTHKGGEPVRWNRSYEFDSTNQRFPDFVLGELMPRVESLRTRDGRPIRVSRNAGDRAAMGGSTGGIGSFTLAWERPDAFSRVYSEIGTFVSMRGGHDYPAIIRKTEPKPIRVFLEDGSTDAWNPLFGSWFMANENMEAALAFAGYDAEHAWGVHGHDGGPGEVILPDVMRWLWRGWPAQVPAGRSSNDMLASILLPGEGWQLVNATLPRVSALASNQAGDVYACEAQSHTVYRIGADGAASTFAEQVPAIEGEAFGPDGTLYATVPQQDRVIALDARGTVRAAAARIRGSHILVDASGSLVVSVPGAHPEEPSEIVRIGANGLRTSLDRGLHEASGIAFSPDQGLLFAAEASTKWVYSYVAQPGGALADREPFYDLHAVDEPDGSGTGDLVVDRAGTLYAATPLGIQVCDRNGRVRAVLWLPTPCGPVVHLCWGGAAFDTLYASDGTRLFRRRLSVRGFPQWSAPIALPRASGG